MCPGTGSILTNSSGKISTGRSTYANSISCQWIIAPTSSSLVSLRFSTFDTAYGDLVTVYTCIDVNCSESTRVLLAQASGSVPPSEIISATGIMLVTFASDARLTASGFVAIYSTPCPEGSFTPEFGEPCTRCRTGCLYGKHLQGICAAGASVDTTRCVCPTGSFDGGDESAPCTSCNVICPEGKHSSS